MPRIKAELTLTWTYDIPDDLDKREELWGTRDLAEAIKVDERQYQEDPTLALLELDNDFRPNTDGTVTTKFTAVESEGQGSLL